MKKIRDLRIGDIDAQYYLNNPDDPKTDLFRRSFYRSTHLEKLHDPDTYFFIGEKGTGKTAYTAYTLLFMKDEFKAMSPNFTGDDFALFSEVSVEIGVKRSQYASLWNFVLATLLLSGAGDHYEFKSNGAISEFLGAITDITLEVKIDTFERAIRLLSSVDELFDSYCERASLPFSKQQRENAAHSFKLDKMIGDCLDELSEYDDAHQFCLFVDSFDVRPEQLDYSEYLEIVTGLCNGAWLLNARQLSKMQAAMKVVLMLRPDIFESVPLQNRSTKLAIHAHYIDWSTRYKSYRNSDIFKLTDYLLFVQQSESTKLMPGDSWNSYFPFRVWSRVNKDGDNPFILFLRYSFYKPRDIVRYLELMHNAYSNDERGDRIAFSDDVFNDPDIRQQFSNYLLLEIQDQAQFYYSISEWQQFKDFNDGYLGNVINKKSRVFDYESFATAHALFLDESKRKGSEIPETFRSADSLLQFMFDLNIIGYHVVKSLKNRDTGERYERTFTNWSFRQRSFANLKPKVPSGGSYVMHFGVAKALFTDFI